MTPTWASSSVRSEVSYFVAFGVIFAGVLSAGLVVAEPEPEPALVSVAEPEPMAEPEPALGGRLGHVRLLRSIRHRDGGGEGASDENGLDDGLHAEDTEQPASHREMRSFKQLPASISRRNGHTGQNANPVNLTSCPNVPCDPPRHDERLVSRGLVIGAGLVGLGAGVMLAEQLLPGADARTHGHKGNGTLLLTVHDDMNGPIPARVTFRPVGDTSKVFFTTIDIGRQDVGAVSAYDRTFVLRGTAEIKVPAGTYDLWFSHGPEWDTTRERVTFKAGEEHELLVKLHHVIDTPGWLSGDFHVHAAPSLDSRVPMRDRVHQFVADGVDLIVSTDHNIISDYGPVIAELGVKDLLASATGDEITTKTWGHFGSFPLQGDESELGRGAIDTGTRTPKQIFADVRAKSNAALIDVHHPRLEHGHIGYFYLAELDHKTGHAKRAGFSWDFDAIEVLNGYQDSDRKTLDAVIADWQSFLDSGKHVAATGNSDSHHMTFNLGGYPRNYVRVDDGPLAKLDPAAVAAAVKAGHSYLTTGPILDVSIDGQGPGDVVTGKGGKVGLHVVVRASTWIALTSLTVLGPGGAVLAKRAIPSATTPLRFDETIPLDLAKDGYAIVRVDGDRAMSPNVGDQGSFIVYPFALANPIWIDVDGDGKVAPSAPHPFDD